MLTRVNAFQGRITHLTEAFSRHRGCFRTFNEAMFSLNIAYAVVYSAFLYISNSQMSWTPKSDLGYYLRRSAVRVDDLLGIPSTAAVSTNAVARSDFPVHRIGLDLTFTISIGCIAFLIFLLLRLSRGTFAYRVSAERVACGSALLLMPACCLSVLALTWKWGRLPEESYAIPFWQSGWLAIFGFEIVIFSVLLKFRRSRLVRWLVTAFVIAHYVFWVFVLWPDIPISIYPLYAPHVLLLVFPLSAVAWLLHVDATQKNAIEENDHAGSSLMFGGGAVAITLLLLLWLPARQYKLASSKDLESLTIQMWRGPCRGPCPQYAITIHGNGIVEYEGVEFVKTRGHQVGKISKEQLMRVLQSLDRASFTSLEDRAFDWCFDTSSVAVLASTQGRTKRVASDGSCVGPNSGPQERFVRDTREIDLAVGSDQWVLCDGHRCR
jgi:hypothetical protein